MVTVLVESSLLERFHGLTGEFEGAATPSDNQMLRPASTATTDPPGYAGQAGWVSGAQNFSFRADGDGAWSCHCSNGFTVTAASAVRCDLQRVVRTIAPRGSMDRPGWVSRAKWDPLGNMQDAKFASLLSIDDLTFFGPRARAIATPATVQRCNQTAPNRS
jgi:hypothetical protein